MAQPGYDLTDESGRIYQLDKDIKIRGNKDYSADACLFVPSKINSLFLISNSAQGDCPPGVSLNREKMMYTAQCNASNGKPLHLGYFKHPLSAHYEWRRYKAKRCTDLSLTFKDHHPELHKALLEWADELSKCNGVFIP